MCNSLTAKEIVYLHKNPVENTGSFGKKIFISENTDNETELVKKSLESIKSVISAERVERRHVRCEAVWLPDIKRAKVTRQVGNISKYGYFKQGDLYLLPEEALFLLEMNHLELFSNEIPFSIEQGYLTLLGKNTCTIEQYRVYQNLALQGFRVKNSSYNKVTSNESFVKKVKLSDDNKPSNAKCQIDDLERKDKTDCSGSSLSNVTDACYNIYSSEASHSKELKHTLKLQSGDDLIHDNISTNERSLLTALSGVDSVAYYQLQYMDFDNV